MLLTWATVLTLLGMLSDPPASAFPIRVPTGELARDPVILAGLWEMFGRAQYGLSKMEEAAFVVAAADGTLSLVRWPGTGQLNRSRWKGSLPAGVIAIVHTHPNEYPRPSRLDTETSIQLSLPVYVITRSAITRTSDGVIAVVVNRPWKGQPPSLARRRSPATALALRESVVSREQP